MSSVIDSLLVKLGFETDSSKLEEFKQKSESLKTSILAVSAVATAAAVGLGMMVMTVARGMDDVGDFADIVDMTAREVAALGKVASMNDSSMEAMKSTIQGVSNVIGQASLGIGRGAKIFETLGFEAKDADGKVKSASDMLQEVADRMKSMNAGERLALASKMGIDSSLIPLLTKGGEAFRKLKEEAEASNPLTEEQYKQADTIVKLWNKAAASAGVFTKVLAAKLFPIMERVLTRWNDLFKAGKKASTGLLESGLDVFVGTLVTLWDWVMRGVSAIESLGKWLGQFKVVVWATAAAIGFLIAYQAGVFFIALGGAIMTAAKALFTFSAAGALPIAIIGGLVLLIALLVDEVVNFYEGNETLIGQLNTEFPGAIYALEAVLGLLVGGLIALKWQAITAFASLLIGAVATAAGWVISFGMMAVAVIAATWPLLLIIGIVAAVGAAAWYLWQNWSTVTGYLGEAWTGFTDLLKSAVSGALEYVVGLFDSAKEKVMGFITTITDAANSVGKALGLTNGTVNVAATGGASGASAGGGMGATGATGAPGGVMGRGDNGTAADGGSGATTTTVTTTVNAPITVNSPDPAKAGEAVRVELDRMNKNVTRNGQSSVMQ